MELVQELLASDAVAACRRAHPEEGWVTLELELVPEVGIELHVVGPLAIEPGGVCLRDAARATIAATELPDGVLGAVIYQTVHLP